MNICFEMAVNALDVSLIISFLIQYFGYKAATPVKYWGTALIWLLSFSVLVFFSWSHLYETYASALQILINILFCFTLLRGSAFQKNVYVGIYHGIDGDHRNIHNASNGKAIREPNNISAWSI